LRTTPWSCVSVFLHCSPHVFMGSVSPAWHVLLGRTHFAAVECGRGLLPSILADLACGCCFKQASKQARKPCQSGRLSIDAPPKGAALHNSRAIPWALRYIAHHMHVAFRMSTSCPRVAYASCMLVCVSSVHPCMPQSTAQLALSCHALEPRQAPHVLLLCARVCACQSQ
jgi:hypothetical protein